MLFFNDFVMLVIASCIAARIVFTYHNAMSYDRVFYSALIWTGVSLWTFKQLGLYRVSYALSGRDEWYYVLAGSAIGIAPMLVLFTIVPSLSTSRLELLISFALAAPLIAGNRSLIHYVFKAHPSERRRSIAVVGSERDVPDVARDLEAPTVDLHVISVENVESAITENLAGARASWYNSALSFRCDEIVFAGWPTSTTPLMVECAARDRVKVSFAPPGLSSNYCSELLLSAHHGVLHTSRRSICAPSNRFFKRVFDIVVASVALPLAIPIMAMAALAVLLESGAPVIYKQTRVGRDGKHFEILKLRSMIRNAEDGCGPVWCASGAGRDSRATAVGDFIRRTSIDELPQLFNVLRGEMSVVGPRPERPIFVEQFSNKLPRYLERHLTNPGITGWAQLHMRRNPDIMSIDEKLEMDLFYVQNYSMFLDVSLVLKTAVEVLFHQP
jgi:exopolysaccharide biosynthesis polyprenyl glycosylphosphotransferase